MQFDSDLKSVQEVRSKVDAAYQAWGAYRKFPQEQVDRIVEAMAAAARTHSRRLAELAVEETGYGKAEDKLAKNLLACDILPRALRGVRCTGLLSEDKERKVVEIGVPMGVVAAILPTTNPTSTAIYKTIIALKAGNAIVVSPHPRARRCSCETVAILQQAAAQAGAPDGVIQCIGEATIEGTNELMRHKRTAVILSTGGSGIVRAAYSSGKPAFGVGPGNVPVLVDVSADLGAAVGAVVQGKTFDYGTVCSSEQTIVAERGLRDRIVAELKSRGAFFCDDTQAKALAKVLLTPAFMVTADCVGQAPGVIARKAGFQVPDRTTLLVAEIAGVGKEHPLSAEKLSPVLSLLFVDSFAAALDACEAILRFGGLGHTSVIHAQDDARIREYAMRMPSYRVIANSPSPQGTTGITTDLQPAMTLGCGAVAGNITSDNIGPMHLVNIKRLAYPVREVASAFSVALPEASASAASVGGANVDRARIADAVERYLAKRGVHSAPVLAPPRAPASTATPAAETAGSQVVSDLVERAISARRVTPPVVATPPVAATAPPSSSPAPAPPAPPAPVVEEVPIVDFVCEDDVRRAINKNRKIFIGPKTIVTPSARDLASQHDVLVLARR